MKRDRVSSTGYAMHTSLSVGMDAPSNRQEWNHRTHFPSPTHAMLIFLSGGREPADQLDAEWNEWLEEREIQQLSSCEL